MATTAFRFFKATMPSTRPAAYILGCAGGRLYMDFNVSVKNKCLYLVRISFDGFGCCDVADEEDVESEAPLGYLSEEDTSRFIAEVSNTAPIDDGVVAPLVQKLLAINKAIVWEGAVERYGLMLPAAPRGDGDSEIEEEGEGKEEEHAEEEECAVGDGPFGFARTTMPASRKADYYLSCCGGSVYMDFNVSAENKCLYLVRISFDGYGCCRVAESDAKAPLGYLSEEDTSRFIAEVTNTAPIDDGVVAPLVQKLLAINKAIVWEDAVEEYELMQALA